MGSISVLKKGECNIDVLEHKRNFGALFQSLFWRGMNVTLSSLLYNVPRSCGHVHVDMRVTIFPREKRLGGLVFIIIPTSFEKFSSDSPM